MRQASHALATMIKVPSTAAACKPSTKAARAATRSGSANEGDRPSATVRAPPRVEAPACASADHRAFDFWVGRWDVYPTAQPEKLVAHSLIERLYGGCAVRENWSPLSGNDGTAGSLDGLIAAAPINGGQGDDKCGTLHGARNFSGVFAAKNTLRETPDSCRVCLKEDRTGRYCAIVTPL